MGDWTFENLDYNGEKITTDFCEESNAWRACIHANDLYNVGNGVS